jgi:hypothetical protein
MAKKRTTKKPAAPKPKPAAVEDSAPKTAALPTAGPVEVEVHADHETATRFFRAGRGYVLDVDTARELIETGKAKLAAKQ